MKRPYPSQKCYILAKLKMAQSGQGWERLKILLILLSVKIRSRGSSSQTFGAAELGSPIISTSRSLMSIANMALACQELGLMQGQSILASSFLPSPVPLLPLFLLLSTTRSILVLFLLPLLLLSHQGRSSSQYGCHGGRAWENLGAELKKISVCLFLFVFFIYFFCNSFSIYRLCLSPSLYTVTPLYINKGRHFLISYILSLLSKQLCREQTYYPVISFIFFIFIL